VDKLPIKPQELQTVSSQETDSFV